MTTKTRTRGTTRTRTREIGQSIRRFFSLRNIVIILAAVGLIFLAGFLIFGVILQPPPSGVGYARITLIDGETGDEIEGIIIFVPDSNQSAKLGDAETGETFFISEPSFAYVSSVTLKQDVSRVLLPKAFIPEVSNDINNPAENQIVVWFYLDPSDVLVNITKLNSVSGNFNETDIPEDTLNTIELTFNISVRHSFNYYGHFSFALDHLLEASYPETLQAELGGYATWLVFNGTKPANIDWIVDDILETPIYIESKDITLIQVVPSFMTPTLNVSIVEVIFEIKSPAIEVFVFQGFLEDLASTKKLIGIKD